MPPIDLGPVFLFLFLVILGLGGALLISIFDLSWTLWLGRAGWFVGGAIAGAWLRGTLDR